MMSIPKKIYYCWFGHEKPQKVINCINNWKEKLPDYEIIEINENNKELFDVEKECQNNLWFKTVWEQKIYAYASDYARLKVLYGNGGIYFDTDITVCKNLNELLNKDKLIMGFEDSEYINGAVIIANKNNSDIEEMINFYNNDIWEKNLYSIPHIITYILKNKYELNQYNKITENDNIFIVPPEYFYPLPSQIRDLRQGNVTENTYTIHWWNACWLKSNIEYFLRNKNKIELNKLISLCFEEKIIIDNSFIKIKKIFKNFCIDIDFSYLFKFRHKYYNNCKYLVLFFFGIEIKVWKGNRV